MARRKKDQPLPGATVQLSIFDLIKEQLEEQRKSEFDVPEAGSMNISLRLREELSRGLKQCSCSRYEVAAKMSEALGSEITKSQLDSWTAESKEYHRFPAEYLPSFCRATGYAQPLRVMAEMLRCYLLESEDALLAELGKIDQQKRDLGKKEKAVRELLETMRGQTG